MEKPHYVCGGTCKGVSDHQKNCGEKTCTMYDKPLVPCTCNDGKHAVALDEAELEKELEITDDSE